MAVYEALINEVPDHAGAWHLLGVALNQKGKTRAAVVHIKRALAHCDTKAVYWP